MHKVLISNQTILGSFCLSILLIVTGISTISAQETGDEFMFVNDTLPEEYQSPRKAALYSAVLPGLGQIYNRKYWKVPIIYAGLGTIIYFIDYYNTEYHRYRTAYLYRVDGDPRTIDEFADDPRYTQDVLIRFKDTARRWRDLDIIILVGAYLFQIIDATVDAYLFDYDISDDLSLRITPMLLERDIFANNTFGIRCSFKF